MATSPAARARYPALAGCVLALAGCAPPTAPVAPPTTTERTAATSDASSSVAPTALSVHPEPGRSLAVTCSGEGEPTVVFLHGLIQPQDDASWAHSPGLRALVQERTRYCEYERANVGNSSPVAGPIPVEQTVADLGAVLDAVGATAPVVLVGGSFGGLVAYTFAGTYPERVDGVVLVDPTLPDEPALDAYVDPALRVTPDAWRDSAEKIDVHGAYATARAALVSVPEVPGTIVVTEDLWAPVGPDAESFRLALRQQQADLVAAFTPAETVVVDATHTTIPPDVVADAVTAVLDLLG